MNGRIVMKTWSIPAGRILGTELRIHWTFFLLPLFVWFTEYKSHGAADPGRDIALVAIIFACVVAHELGHALLARRIGMRAKSTTLLPIGGIMQMDETALPSDPGVPLWRREIQIAAAGPLINVVLAIVAAGVITAFVPDVQLWSWPFVQPSSLLRATVWINLYLAGINLLPAYPLDAGHVLRALFSRTLDPVSATRRALSIGQTMATLLIVVGMLSNIWLTLLGSFVFIAAQLEERLLMFKSVLETVRLEEVMLTDFATLSPADTLEDALEKAVHSLQDDFPVIRGGDMVGVISRQKILKALRLEGNGYVQAAMDRIFDVATRSESLASAFRKLAQRNAGLVPVVEDQRLVGIVTLQILMHSMSLLAESRRLRKSMMQP
jgi:Zn-dependent protease/predicted transcriptional regulator